MSYTFEQRVETDMDKMVVFSSLFFNSWRTQQKRIHDLKKSPDGYVPTSSFKFSWTKGIDNLFLKDYIFVPIVQR